MNKSCLCLYFVVNFSNFSMTCTCLICNLILTFVDLFTTCSLLVHDSSCAGHEQVMNISWTSEEQVRTNSWTSCEQVMNVMNYLLTSHWNVLNFLRSCIGGWVVGVFAEIEAFSAQLSWRLAGWLGLTLAILSIGGILNPNSPTVFSNQSIPRGLQSSPP